jgi:hypothetical protein
MAYYSDWAALIKEAQMRSATVLAVHVAPVAEEILNRNIQTDIYDVYTPTQYVRRNALGDPRNTVSRIRNGETLVVTNIAPPETGIASYNQKAALRDAQIFTTDADTLLQAIEQGAIYNVFNSAHYIWEDPRTAVADTQVEFAWSGEIARAIQKGIEAEF